MTGRAKLWIGLFLLSGLLAWPSHADPADVASPETKTTETKAGDGKQGDTKGWDLFKGVDVTQLAAIITAIGALGLASFSLVDATKAFGGGISRVGFGDIKTALDPFSCALDHALDKREKWLEVVRSHWINGRPRDEQKAIVKSLIRLGLTRSTVQSLAKAGHVDPTALDTAVAKLESGAQLIATDTNVLGRLDASVEAQLDAAFDRADQRYRNYSRVAAAVCSLGLSVLAAYALNMSDHCAQIVLVGLLAVPLAPISKDLASSLQAAAQALRSAK